MLSFLSVRRKGRGTPKSISKITKLFVPNKNLLQCKVVFLDGTDISLDLSKKAIGGDLYKWVFYSLDLIEKDYFGLQYTDADNVEHWLDSNKAVKKQVKVGPPYTFYLKVKFYSSEPNLLQEELTRYQFFLQLKHDIVEGKLPCPPEKAVELCALALQSELGDFDEKRHTPALISEFRFIPDQTEEFEVAVLEAYQSCTGLTPAQAEINYLSKVIWLPNYAVKNYVVLGNDSNEYYLGLMPTGVKLVEGSEQIGLFRWPNILRLDFKKEKITLVAVDDNGHEEHTFVFRLHDKKTCKRLWKSAVEYHTFFRLHAPGKAPTVRQNFFRMGSRFWYRGKTDAPHSQQCEPRRSAQFERRPSQRHARRQSHVLRLAQQENADTLPSKMNLSRCRGDESISASKLEVAAACMTTIEETADSDVASETRNVDALVMSAPGKCSALEEVTETEEVTATEELTTTEVTSTGKVAAEEISETEKEAIIVTDIEATVTSSMKGPSTPPLSPLRLTADSAQFSVNCALRSASVTLELQPNLERDPGQSTLPSTPTFTPSSVENGVESSSKSSYSRAEVAATPTFAPLSINNSFKSAPTPLELEHSGVSTPPYTPTFTPLSINNSVKSAFQPLKLELAEVLEVSSPPCTPTFAPFSINSSFKIASKTPKLELAKVLKVSSPPRTPTFAPFSTNSSVQSASKPLKVELAEVLEVSSPPRTPTFAPLSINNSFKSVSKPLKLELAEAPEVSTPPRTPTFAPFPVNNIFPSASNTSELSSMQRVASPPSTPTLKTSVIEVPAAKLLSTAE